MSELVNTYRRKPIIQVQVLAIQFQSNRQVVEQVFNFMQEKEQSPLWQNSNEELVAGIADQGFAYVKTSDGLRAVKPGDWIVKLKNESGSSFEKFTDEEFKERYELVLPEPQA